MAKKDKQIQFEEAFKRLEESMTLFEEGITLTEKCKSRLEAAEQKIQLLIKNSDGNLSLENTD